MILCIGTTPTMQRTMTFDRLIVDDVNRARAVHEHASGKSVNVARVLSVLGQEAPATGFCGGRRGAALIEDMNQAGIAHDFVPVENETRLCTTIIDQSSGQATELVEEAPPASAAQWGALIEKIEGYLSRAEALVFSGTLAPGAPEDFIDRWIGRAAAVVVDAKGQAMRRALSADGRVIAKLNRDEFAQTLNANPQSDADLCQAMRGAAPADGWLIVTLGKQGAMACIENRIWRVTAPAIQAVSPIGSGDAFTAGLVAALDRGAQEALRLGCACGAANALTPYSGQVGRAEVDRLLREVRVEWIDE